MKKLILLITCILFSNAQFCHAGPSEAPLEWKHAGTGALTYPYEIIATYTDNGDGTITLSTAAETDPLSLHLNCDNDPLTGPLTINTNSTTALKVEQTGVKNNTLVVDTTNGRVGINCQPGQVLELNDDFRFQWEQDGQFWIIGPVSSAGIEFLSGLGITAFADMCRIGSANELNKRIDITGNLWKIDGWVDDTVRHAVLFPSTITIGASGATAGVNLSATNGILTLIGQKAAGNNENLILDFETTANNVIFSSTTGVTRLNFSALNLLTTGTLGAGAITGTSLKTNGTLSILEGGATPIKYTVFQGGDQTVDLTYTLPTTLGAAGTVLTDPAGNGVLSWAAGGSVGKWTVETKTDDYSVLTTDVTKTLVMNNAGTKTFSLPSVAAGDIGTWFTFAKIGAGKVIIDAADSDKIADSGAGDTIYNDQALEVYATITLELVSETQWVITGADGIWVTTD